MTFVLAVCLSAISAFAQETDPLPSWREGDTKRAILAFVAKVTDVESPGFVPARDRVATFDNDGTLWTEKPLYVHFLGVLQHMKAQMQADPKLADREPYRSVAKKDLAYFTTLYENAAYESLAGQLLGVPFGGMTHEQFDAWGRRFLAEFKHPRFGVGVERLVFQPMIELVRFLEAQGFIVYISTADEGAFLRLVSHELYGLPASRILGSRVRSEFVTEAGRLQLVRTYRLEHLNNWDGKPRLIDAVIGKKPILAAGNSNGDQHMLQYAAQAGGISLLVHHTDAEREYAYDSHTDKVMPLAKKHGWTVVDMKQDWSVIFPASREKRR